jgi:hypothetical protein
MKKILYILCFIPLLCYSQNIIIGDSQTPYIDKNSTKVEKIRSLWKGGIGVLHLTKMVNAYPISPDIKNVVICIGTNDRFGGKITYLLTAIKEKFPKAKLYVIQGSWGWGGNKNITLQKVKTYYNQYHQEGVIVIDPPIGKNEPHRDLPEYKIIGRKLDSLIK